MATKPDDADAGIAAALLPLGARYSLPQLIRAARVRPRPFRQIVPTGALRSNLARPYLEMLRAWAAEQPAIDTAYRLALATGDAEIITRQIDRSAQRVAMVRAEQERRLGNVFDQLERWHRQQWNARIRSATGLDVAVLTLPSDVRSETSAAVEWNRQLIRDVDRQAGAGVAAALLAGLAARASAEAARRDVTAVIRKARRRSLRIGVDQVDRTSRAFDRARRRAAGLDRFRWHHTPQQHPRNDHRARDGRVYSQSNAPNDRAGTLPNCRCWEEPLFD